LIVIRPSTGIPVMGTSWLASSRLDFMTAWRVTRISPVAGAFDRDDPLLETPFREYGRIWRFGAFMVERARLRASVTAGRRPSRVAATRRSSACVAAAARAGETHSSVRWAACSSASR
jgi:hypothetical protein